MWTFYKEKNESSFFTNLKSLFKLVFYKNTHSSKLQTALYNAINSMKDTIRSKKQRWISKVKKSYYFQSGNKIYKDIRNKKIASGVIEKSPVESTDLHKVNVISAIVKDHSTNKRFLISN